MSIAEAAVYLKAHEPEPGDRKPLRAERRTVRSGGQPAEGTGAERRRILVGRGKADLRPSPTATTRSAPPGSTSTSHWKAKAKPVAASPASQGFLPEEGATGWSDTWMISSQAKHPNCMYMWMNYIISPKANAEVAEFFGEAPAQSLACKETEEPELLHEIPRGRPGLLEARLLLGDAARRMRQRRRRLHGLQRLGPGLDLDQRLGRPLVDGCRLRRSSRRRSVGRRLAGLFHGRPRLQIGALLAGPVGWLVILYLGSLVVLLIAAFWTVDPLSGERASRSFSLRKLRNAGQRTGLPGHRLADRPHRRAGHASPTRSSPSRSPSTWPRWRAAAARRSSSSRC